MLQFFKYTFATIFGLFLFCILFLFLLVGIANSASKKKATAVKEKSVLVLDFKGRIMERCTDDKFAKLTGEESKIGLNDLLENIEKAKNDANIQGILLDLNAIAAGAATKEEIRNALLDFKKSGKFIYSKADYYYNGNYYLASVADKIFLTPTGEMLFNGTSAEPMFYKGMLDKIGVEIQVVRHGKFKGAVEPFIKDKLSDENRLQIRKYKESLYSIFMNNIATQRNINIEEL